MTRRIYFLGIFLFFSTLLFSCGSGDKKVQPPPPPVAVVTYQVQRASVSYYDEYPATLVALNEVQLRPQVSGYINGIFFSDGQHVSKGQKLYSIDQQQYQAAYDQAQAGLNVAKANLERAQQDADRYQELQKNDAIARQTVEHALADLQASKMQLEAARANVSNVQTNLRYSTIFAPFDGTIGISQVKLGTAVSPGQTWLNTVSSDDPINVEVAVDQKEIGRFLTLQQHPGNGTDSIFSLKLPDQSVYPFSGKISLVDRAVDPQTGTIKARIQFPNHNKLLKAGMNCNLRILNQTREPVLLIPSKAVVEQMGEFFVFAVGDSSKVVQKKISRGATINDKVVVTSGLSDNDQIITEGVQKLRDGSHIQIVPPGSKPPAGKN